MIPKPRRFASESYLEYVRSRPCIVCAAPADPHHLIARGAGGSDLTCVPLCREHHTMVHSMPQAALESRWGLSLWEEAHRTLRGFTEAILSDSGAQKNPAQGGVGSASF
jgi:hypothetical protein